MKTFDPTRGPQSSRLRPAPGEAPAQGSARAPRYLAPGQVIASSEPTEITTIVGSCVAVCLWDRGAGIGGMIHYLLPRAPAGSERSGRFGDLAFRMVFAELAALGATSLQARIVGGACLIDAFRGRERPLGDQNLDVALKVLREAGVPVIENASGGSRGRRIVFCTDDGSAKIALL